eukprot:TRINITY_DN38634_c0_g1_i1.p1 TRINITY_DN38634_c0_g1~~TRINITY_DN38634_c0_g1_i1.p1  ORF type:complete len:329 (-),score=60.24 TRINITY_DN38634_c0_g1_i1:450-1436(-)
MNVINFMRGVKGPSGFGGGSTAEEVTAGVNLAGKVAIVTGTTAGIGEETARVLALRGAHVVMAVRSVGSGEEVAKNIKVSAPDSKLDVMELDLSSFQSVRSFTKAFKAKGLPLNILVNNAGIMMPPFGLTKDGYEMQFGTNHLGHFLLTTELLPVLKATAKSTKSESRIVMTASMAHRSSYKGGIMFDKLNDKESYSAPLAYGQSKLANVLCAKELARRLQAEGNNDVTVNALCPGIIPTKLSRHVLNNFWAESMRFAVPLMKNISQGAATQSYLAANPQVAGVTGKYFYDCNEGRVASKEAEDMELAGKLWDYSEKAVAASPSEATS